VSAPEDAIVLMEGEPTVTAFDKTNANVLQTPIIARKYVAAVTRHAAGTSQINGAGYTSSLT
jgi:hypothetical protein